MADLRLDGHPTCEQVVASVATLVSMMASPPVAFDRFTAAAGQRGWTAPSRPSLFATDLPTVNSLMSVTELDGRATSARLRFTDSGDPDSGNLFAAYTTALSEAWGNPVKRKRGKIPAIHWALPEMFVTLTNYQGNLIAEVLDPKAYEAQLAAGSI